MLQVKLARLSDKRQVLELTSRTFSWGDYWPHYYDTWLQDKRAAVLVAEVDGEVAGVVYAKLREDGVRETSSVDRRLPWASSP